jgi:hypothetical protein
VGDSIAVGLKFDEINQLQAGNQSRG